MDENLTYDLEYVDQNGEVVTYEDATKLEVEKTPDAYIVEIPVEEETVYTVDNPLPVTIVEETAEATELEVFSLTGTYAGLISETYLSYFRGIVQKLGWNEHYVLYRSGEYSYTMFYGKEIKLDESGIKGNGTYVNLYRDSNSYSSYWYTSTGEDSFTISDDSLCIYSDLGMNPELREGGSHVEFTAVLFAVCFFVVYGVCHDIFDYIMEHVYRR